MSDSTAAGPVPQDQVGALLLAVDQAFEDVLHGRYGGGIHSVFFHGLRVKEQQLRAAPGGSSAYLILELHIREQAGTAKAATGFGRLAQGLASVIGHVTVSPPPEPRAADIRVVTEVFEDGDSGEHMSTPTLSTGLFLVEGPSPSSMTPGPGAIHVVRSQAAGSEMEKRDRLGQRGWLPRPVRNRPNRAGGLGSNGHRRAPTSSTSAPVAASLLHRLGDRLAAGGSFGGALERVVVGLELGD